MHSRRHGCLSRGQCDPIQRRTQIQRSIRLEPEFIQKDDLIALPADEQGFGRPTRRRPAFDERIKIRFRVNAQNENAQRPAGVPFVENGNQDCQIDVLVVIVAVEILNGHLTRPQDERMHLAQWRNWPVPNCLARTGG